MRYTMPSVPTLLLTTRPRQTVDKALSAIVRGELAVKRIKRYEVAEELNLSYGMACRKVRGTRPWTLGEVAALGKLLDVDPVSLAMCAYERAVA